MHPSGTADEPAGSGPSSPAPAGPSLAAGWTLLLTVSFVLYAATASRGIQWQDAGHNILRAMTGEVHHPLGLALAHPLHHLLGRLAVAPGWLEPALAVTLISSLAGAFAVANTFGCVRLLTRNGGAGLFAAGSLAVCHTCWQWSTLAETYTLTAALLAGECWCLVAYVRSRHRRFLWGMLLLNGLGLGNHLQALLTTPVLAIVALLALRRREVRWPGVAIGAVLWVAGSLPYTALVLTEMLDSGQVIATVRSALFGRLYSNQVLSMIPSARVLAVSLAAILYSFPNLLIPAAVYGLLRPRSQDVPALAWKVLLAGLILHALFVLRYNVIDQHTFLLPTYVLLALFAGIGAARVLRWPNARRRRFLCVTGVVLCLTTPAVYGLASATARRAGLFEGTLHNKPYRDDYAYLLTPWSVAERSAERMSTQAVDLAGPRGTVISEDPMARFALEYQRLRRGWSELNVVVVSVPNSPKGREILGESFAQASRAGRDVVLVPMNADRPAAQPPVGYRWRREGDLYQLEPDPSVTGRTPRPTSRSGETR